MRSADRFEELLAAPGRELLSVLRELDPGPEDALRTATALRARYPAGLVAGALSQHELRRRARAKFSRAGEMFFTRDGLEQASSELIARHRARRFAGSAVVADLCCGIGGDLIALACEGGRVLAVDLDPLHLRMAQENAAVYGVAGAVTALRSDVRDASLAGVAAAFIDPARRAGGQRFRAGTSEPPLSWCLALAGRTPAVAIKAAPGLAREEIPAGWELEFIAVGRELKEAVAWSPALATASRRATILAPDLPPADAAGTAAGAVTAARAITAGTITARTITARTITAGTITAGTITAGTITAGAVTAGAPTAKAHTMVRADADQAAPPVPVRPAGGYLCDPSPAITRAGLVEDLARELGAWKIDERIAFLSSDAPLPTPFGRSLRVVDSGPWNEKRLSARLRALDIGAVDIRRRNLAGDVDLLRRRLKLDGRSRATLIMTRSQDRPWALICVDCG